MLHLKGSTHFAIKKSIFGKIFMRVLIPVIITTIIVAISYNYFQDVFEKEIEGNYKTVLSGIADNIDNMLEEIQNTTQLLASNRDIYNILYSDEAIEIKDYVNLHECIKSLGDFRITKHLIDSSFIIHAKSRVVISANGMSRTSDFFSNIYNYSEYDLKFWESFKPGDFSGNLLRPSVVNADSGDITSNKVIPFAINNIGGTKISNLFIVNISENRISDILNQYKLSPNSHLSIIDKEGNLVSSTNREKAAKGTLQQDFLVQVRDTNKDFFTYDENGKKMLVVHYTSRRYGQNNLTYVASIPYSDVYEKPAHLVKISYVIIFFGLVLAVFISYLMSRNIYTPIKNLVHLTLRRNDTSKKEIVNSNEFEYLNRHINEIFDERQSLEKDLSLVIPLASENFLLKVLTNNDFFLDTETKKFLAEHQFDFPNPCFCVCIISLHFKDHSEHKESDEEKSVLLKSVCEKCKQTVTSKYPANSLILDRKRVCLIINVPEKEAIEAEVFSMVQDICADLDRDENASFTAGIGRVYRNFIGMNMSYNEALSTVAGITKEECVKVFGEKKRTKYTYSITDENKMFNYLLSGNSTEAEKLLQHIIRVNTDSNISEDNLRKLCMSLYNTAIRVMDLKNVTTFELPGNELLNAADFENMDIQELADHIANFFLEISSYVRNVGKINISQVMEYIDENFTKDIYLEQIADRYDTTAKYLSKVLKVALGVGFQEYLCRLRVTRAKSLLSQEGKSIIDIGRESGFNNHSTFFRILKKYEGVSPAEYRENNKK